MRQKVKGNKQSFVYEIASIPNAPHPTSEIYSDVISAFNHFNQHLFDDQLSEPVFTLQNKPSMRFSFREERFEHQSGIVAHEIGLNPIHCAGLADYDVLAIIVHAMCLEWRYELGPANAQGVKPSRGYHDVVTAAKMVQLGLIPSETGEPGGKKTGYNLSHYIDDDGLFDLAARDLLITGFAFRWQAIVQKPEADGDEDNPNAAPKSRIKYSCEICDLNAWAKADAQTCRHFSSKIGFRFDPIGLVNAFG